MATKNETIGAVTTALLDLEGVQPCSTAISVEEWDMGGAQVTFHGVTEMTSNDQEYRVFITRDGDLGGSLERHYDAVVGGMTRWHTWNFRLPVAQAPLGWVVVARDYEGGIATTFGPFATEAAAEQYRGHAEIQLREEWAGGDFKADAQEWLDEDGRMIDDAGDPLFEIVTVHVPVV